MLYIHKEVLISPITFDDYLYIYINFLYLNLNALLHHKQLRVWHLGLRVGTNIARIKLLQVNINTYVG